MRTPAKPVVFGSILFVIVSATVLSGALRAQEAKQPRTPVPEEKAAGGEEKDPMNPGTFAGLKFRSIGPAFMSGRIVDIAVHPTRRQVWWVAAASGGVWKTENAGTTWTPVFDDQGSYSIGCVAVDPSNPHVVWVGTGENNSQRSVSFGDGVYRSLDGGKTWKRVGLEHSEHIGKILVNPRDSDMVYVAAQGPLWKAGGDRGLYKTVDGGKTWKKVLEISENTGVTDVVMDPRDPDVLYAAAYQRRRRVWTLIDGGPESAVYKSTDGGAHWEKLGGGLPGGDVGRIGLALSPADPDVVYAIVEAANGAGGFFRSLDRGASWEKRSSYVSGSPQYYQEIFCDPEKVDRVYSMDTPLRVTEDGGKTFTNVGGARKHVDNHALWIDPDDTDHLICGCDGGLYETFDRGKSWQFKPNLPVTQFYRVAVDNSFPFYYVYGGTQDNATQGGPSRTRYADGIVNADWFVTVGGDGFETQVDPEDPNVVYSQWQYGGLVRYDRRTGETVDIQPQPGPEGPALHWNWDSPLIISPHSHTRLYFGANILFRSDDRGDSWRPVSPDLTRKIDRNRLEVMGRIQPVDAVAKHASTSMYGNLVALAESPLEEGLLYAGTDDGLVQVTEDGGKSWRRTDTFPGVPDMTYVSFLLASNHDAGTVYAAFDNHKNGDFKPYLLVSRDRGRTWTSITGDLPDRGPVLSLAEDPAEGSTLFFAGTEFGVYFTVDGGKHWVRLKGGIPTIAVRDMAIQAREGDLVLGTFGRGFYILDDYTPLRGISREKLRSPAVLFPVRRAWMYIPMRGRGGSQGGLFFSAPNPPFGAVFTYYLKEGLKTLKDRRKEREKASMKMGKETYLPTLEELRAEKREKKPKMVLTVRDGSGQVVRRVNGPASKGFHRVAWDLRYPSTAPGGRGQGPLAMPGTYTVTLERWTGETHETLAGPVTFETRILGTASLPAPDRAEVLAFQQKVARLQRAVMAAVRALDEAKAHLAEIEKVLPATPAADPSLLGRARRLELRLLDLDQALRGDRLKRSLYEADLPSITERVQRMVGTQWNNTGGITGTSRRNYRIAGEAFTKVLTDLRTLLEHDLKELEEALEKAGAPWTPGRRLPEWKMEGE